MVHVVARNNGKAISLNHGGVPVFPASNVELAVTDSMVNTIDCAIRLQVRVPGLVHLNWPDEMVVTLFSLLLLYIHTDLIVVVDRTEVDCSS